MAWALRRRRNTTVTRHRGRRAGALAALVATVALIWTLGPRAADAAGLPSGAPNASDIRQAGGGMTGTAPGSSPGSSGPMDIGLAEVGFVDLPVSAEAGEAFQVRVQAPGGAACSAQITYPGGRWQALDEVGTRVDPCTWDVTVPFGTRPGSLVLAADIGRGGQGRNVLGVVYVSTRTVG